MRFLAAVTLAYSTGSPWAAGHASPTIGQVEHVVVYLLRTEICIEN